MGLNKFEALVPTLEMWAQQLHLLKVNPSHQQATMLPICLLTEHTCMWTLVGFAEGLKQTDWQTDTLADR